MKIVKTLGAGAFTLMLIALCMSGLDYVLGDDTNSWTRIMLHELYEQEDIDSLFLGASHVYSGIDPAIVDEAWGQNTFSCSSSMQRINTSYALLKEAGKLADIDTCYLEMTVGGVAQTIGREKTPEVYNVSDYMKLSWNKISYLLDAVQPEDYINAFCRARRNWKSIYSLSAMRETVSRKSGEDYKNYVLEKKTSYYAGKGFIYVSGNRQFQNVAAGDREPFGGYIPGDYISYFQKIVKYCRENNIKLVCFSVPLPEYTLETIGNYDEYYMQAKHLCKEYGVDYYDFNLADPSVLDMQDSDFRDSNHLNGVGAERFTRVLAEFFAGDIEEGELFCKSYEEKKERLPKRFIGLAVKRDERGEACEIRPVTTKEDDYQYEVYYEDENGDYIPIQEKSSNRKVIMPKKEKVKLRIRVFDSEGNKVAGFTRNV